MRGIYDLDIDQSSPGHIFHDSELRRMEENLNYRCTLGSNPVTILAGSGHRESDNGKVSKNVRRETHSIATLREEHHSVNNTAKR